jgi:hypothetical protein
MQKYADSLLLYAFLIIHIHLFKWVSLNNVKTVFFAIDRLLEQAA